MPQQSHLSPRRAYGVASPAGASPLSQGGDFGASMGAEDSSRPRRVHTKPAAGGQPVRYRGAMSSTTIAILRCTMQPPNKRFFHRAMERRCGSFLLEHFTPFQMRLGKGKGTPSSPRSAVPGGVPLPGASDAFFVCPG